MAGESQTYKHAHQRLVIAIKRAANWINASNAARIQPFGLTLPQWNILMILRGARSRSLGNKEILAHLLYPESNVSRLVDKLLIAGLVSRVESKTDRRAVEIIITKSGLSLLENIDKTEKDWVKRLQRLPKADATLVASLLEKLIAK